jgi:amino acid adenylation domain-containing protein/thioester reductase-like protein/non-ribosomal peptide synthase protein (TIGR01720 family)
MQNTEIEMLKEVVEGYRLSPQQRHLWSLQQRDHSLPYRVQCAVLIKGDLNTNILKAALKKVVNRHEILRTTFRCLPGMTIPFQVITDISTLSVDYRDLSSLPLQEQDAKIEALFNELSRLPLNLEQDLPLHVSLITLSQDKHTLLISLPAMSADTTTLRNLVREISRCYAACLCGEELSDEPLQYADIAEWQNELLEGEEGELGRTYWHQQDISELLTLKLPFEYQTPENLEFRPQLLTTAIHSDLAARIEALVQKYDTSASVLLLACWQVLLWRLTDHSNIIVGTAYEGRKYEELQQALGLFAKYLPIPGYLKETLQFSQLLQQLDETVNEVYEWQDYFTWKQKENTLEASYFSVIFEFEEQFYRDFAGEVVFAIHKQYTCLERFKLKLCCVRKDDSLIAEFHYDSNLFQVEDIKRLAEQFQKLLEGVANSSEAEISELEILSDRERQQLLVEFNDTQTDYPKGKCIHHLFEEQVERTPDRFAVTFENQQLTYQELNNRANQLAHHLKKQGVEPEVLVGIWMERSLETIVGLLGILKAGGAYVPLDPTYPQERLAFILEETQTPVLLTQERLVDILLEHKRTIICLDTEWKTIAQQSQKNPASASTSENLAYVIYTSGSTGKPKGVQITHQNLVHSTSARINYYREPVNSFLLLSSFAFDSSVAGIFWTLCQGGNLFLPQSGEEQNLPALISLISQNHLSHLLSLPSLYTLLLEQAKPEQLVSLRTVIVAGESCPKTLVTRHQKLLPETSLFNEYGPTEGTVWSSVYRCDSPQVRTQVSIGHPIANTQIYILDSHLHPVPLGVPGELYISGDGLARGYLNRPKLTAEKFIPNPFSNEPGVRLYKTGDLGRYLPDGNIEFLGRIDRQVKIRGFRIELGEIEAVLSQHPGVRSLAVIDTEDESGNKRLVVYIVPHQGQLPSTKDLRRFLEEKLPTYMVPSAFVPLKALPRLPNGKVDIKALPAPETVRRELLETFVAPRTPAEKTLAKIWTQVLRVEQVGIHDNFFELGGDSILSIQIVAKANQAGLQLLPKQLFDNPTIAELAKVAGTTTQTIQAEQGLVTGEVPLTPIQHWFFTQNHPDPHHWNQALLLEVPQAFNPMLLEKMVQQLLVHHDGLRLRFVHKEAGWQQFLASTDEAVPVTTLDLSTLPEEEQKFALESAAAKLQTSLNLSSGPLVRVAFFKLGTNKPNRLLLIIHHLAIDGVSWRILLEDIQTAYEQLQRSEAIQLPPKTTSFKQWAELLAQYAQSAAVQQDSDYWFAQPRWQVFQLPVDFPRGDNTVASARTISVALSVAETQALLQKVPATYQTQINDVLLTALVQAFEQWTGNNRLLVDLEGHGREEIFDDVELSRTVGWFTTHFPVLLNLGEASDRGEALKAIKEQLRGIPNRGIGYGVLRYLSRDQAIGSKLQALPQAKVIFNYLGQSDQVLSESSLFAPAQESSGPNRSLRGSRCYLLDINAIVSGGQLQINWTYSKAIHRRATIESLAENFLLALRSLVAHCLETPLLDAPAARGYTPRAELLAALNADSVLDPTIRPETVFVEPTTEPVCIFLTGATGFVGAFLLYELLQQTTADIYCLVRAPNAELGKNRIQKNLESYLLWNESQSRRIIPIIGDLSQPLLGLDEEQFRSLAEKLDVIYHNAAFINLVYPYSVVRAANVLGTQEILRLASFIKVKAVYFMSTLDVLRSVNCSEGKKILEVDNLDNVGVPDIGYVQSKWVAEKLVITARERGIPVSIYRLGRMSGHSQTGVSNTNDFMHRVLKGCIQLGSVPNADIIVDMTPVDYVSRAIIHLSKQKESLGKAFHVCNLHPIHWRDLVSWLRSFGYPIRQISVDKWQSMLMHEWRADLSNDTEFNAKNTLHSLALLFPEQESQEQTSNSAVRQYDCQNTLNRLANTSIVCPPVDSQLLLTYFSYLVQTGFLDDPQRNT